ncbi:MAG: lysophospholipid acyltransferase family protein [Pseudomonadota bacterium]
MRSLLFTIAYWALSVGYVLAALPLLILPTGRPLTIWIRSYTRAMRKALHWLAGVRTIALGKDRLPSEGAYIVAAKHQSWGDGFMVYSEVDDLVFVTGDHLERLPLLGGILKKLGAIVIDTCGGGERKAASLSEGMALAKANNKRVLIYPEGHLAPVDYKMRYKAGVWHMYNEMNVPVVPVATNLGVFWAQESFQKTPGTASIEFLEPIAPGLPKEEFLELLETRIEGRTAELVSDATGRSPVVAEQLPEPPKGTPVRAPERVEKLLKTAG